MRRNRVSLLAMGFAACALGVATRPASAQDVKYLEVPVAGTFGQEIMPWGVEQALKRAADDKVTFVIFRFNSAGGQVWSAKEICKSIDKYQGKVRTIGVIENALSATIWPATSCERLLIGPRARIGAAVAFHTNHTSGAAEVDAKFNSAIAAELATIAEARGHNPLLIRAMILPEVEVYAHPGDDGKPVLTDTRPASADETWTCLSDNVGVLTLTGKEAQTYGLATLVKDTELESVRAALGVASWTSAGVYGRDLMKEAQQKAEFIREKAAKLDAEGMAAFDRYRKNRPEGLRYQVNIYGQFTPESQARWRDASDTAIAELSKFRKALVQWLELKRQAKSMGCEQLIADDFGAKDLIKTSEAIDKLLAELRSNRSRTAPPPELFSKPKEGGSK